MKRNIRAIIWCLILLFSIITSLVYPRVLAKHEYMEFRFYYSFIYFYIIVPLLYCSLGGLLEAILGKIHAFGKWRKLLMIILIVFAIFYVWNICAMSIPNFPLMNMWMRNIIIYIVNRIPVLFIFVGIGIDLIFERTED